MILKTPIYSIISLLSLVLIVNNSSVSASDADRVKQLIDIIRKGPSLYRTQEAAAAYVRFNPQGAAPAVTDEASFAAVKQSIRAAINLSDMGSAAKEAVPALIEVFPRAEHVALIANAQYGPGVGKFEDWVQTYVLSAKNKFVLSSPFIEYQTLSRCEQFVEASAYTDVRNKRMSGQRIVEALADIYVVLRINAAACALSSITGVSPGNSPEAWRSWYASIQVSAAPAPVAPIAPSNKVTIITTPANPPLDYVVGGRYQMRLSTGDIIVGTLEGVDESSITFRLDNGGRYIYEKSFIRDRTLLSAPYSPTYSPAPAPAQSAPPAPARAYPGSVSYEELMNLTYSGKMMEVYLQNGSVLRGTLGVVDASILHLNVDGVEMPVSRSVILRISHIPDPTETKPANNPAGSSGGPTPW
jgi:small nuclear ribonucleoprotein (snRNP)-like protein